MNALSLNEVFRLFGARYGSADREMLRLLRKIPMLNSELGAIIIRANQVIQPGCLVKSLWFP